jgi:hypothetical protein
MQEHTASSLPPAGRVIPDDSQQPGVTTDPAADLPGVLDPSPALTTPFKPSAAPPRMSLLRGGALSLLAGLALCACMRTVTAGMPPSETSKEPPLMTTPSMEPMLSAEQALRRLLTLIGSSQSIADFTPERLAHVMGVPIQHSGEEYGFGERLTAHWSYGIEVGIVDGRPRFDFSFNPRPGTSPAMTDICQLDFDRFTAELEAMGFQHEPYYDSPPQTPPGQIPLLHGRLMCERFYRPGALAGMRIEVYPRGEANEPLEKITHDCVKMILID